MSILEVGMERDHIESLTKATGITAISELIWNSLDADATVINIDFEKPSYFIRSITIRDNGHGLSYDDAKEVFAKIGGSKKKLKTASPGGRVYHGKEGKGRYRSLALGTLVTFNSYYRKNDHVEFFKATIDMNVLSKIEISEPIISDRSTGFEVRVDNVNTRNANSVFSHENRQDLLETLASYWINYPQFKIYFNGKELKFDPIIKSTDETEITVAVDNNQYAFSLKVIEWTFENTRRCFLCNQKGIPFKEINPGLRSPISISMFIQSDYIETLQRDGQLDFSEHNEIIREAHKSAKDFTRDYIQKRLHQYSREFIETLKSKEIYPFKGKPENTVEETKRKVFDILALQLYEHLESFRTQDDKSKKLTLNLLRESLENDSKNLRKILSDVIDLPENKQEELADLLEHTSLSNIIDAMTEIKNRLNFLHGLEEIIHDRVVSESVKERKHLHKFIVKETWIFGDKFSLGVDDVTLKNVLRTYLKYLGRENFEETLLSADNSELSLIPDVCLWQQFSMGSRGRENLVIELKKPSLIAGFEERSQIEQYASRVINDQRFPKDKTRWVFILLVKDVHADLLPSMNQTGRQYGHIIQGDTHDVWILTWGTVITEAKTRLDFLKKKMNLNFKDDKEGLAYIRAKYRQYLPSEKEENISEV